MTGRSGHISEENVRNIPCGTHFFCFLAWTYIYIILALLDKIYMAGVGYW